MKYPLQDYLPTHDPMAPFRGRERDLSQRLAADQPDDEALAYLDALEKESHLADVRRCLEAIFSTGDAPEIVFQRLALPYDENMSPERNAYEAQSFEAAFSDAIELIADSNTDWPNMGIDAYDLAMEMGNPPAALQ